MPSADAAVDWLLDQPVAFFYGAFLFRVALAAVRRRPFEFMEVAAAALSASALPVGVALGICAFDAKLFPRVAQAPGLDLYIALVALLVCHLALSAFFQRQ